MKIQKYFPAIFFTILAISIPVSADMFYWSSEYKSLYDDKVAIELQYEALKRMYAVEKTRFESKIRDLTAAINSLNDRIAELDKRKKDDAATYSKRINDLQSQNMILKRRATNREKELLTENTKLNDRLSAEIRALRDQMESERNDFRVKNDSMQADYNRKLDDLQTRINEQNDEIAKLQKMNEQQKAELNRLSQQAGELEKQLGDEIKKGQIRLKRMSDRIIINLDDKICFDTGSSVLKPEIKKALDKINTIIINYPENRIMIEGNTDNIPIHNASFRDNWQLSTERALSVLGYLLENAKLNPTRISAVGNGEYNPILSNDEAENRALNRRVDIVIIPKVSAK